MLETFLSHLRNNTSNDEYAACQRQHPRRQGDRCIVMIHDQTFPIENWSFGGLLIIGDERLFSAGQELDVTLKFKLRNKILDISHRGHVVRTSGGKIAFKFEPLTKTVQRYLQQVIDDYLAREFANSQAPA